MASASQESSAHGALLPFVLLVAPFGALLFVSDLAASLEAVLGLLSVAFLGLIASVVWLRTRSRPLVWILAVGALLRLLVLPLSPDLSNDVWRYLWDGRVAASGSDPYRLAPSAPELAPLRDADWERLDHRDVPTVYPPLSMAAFSIAARLPGGLWVWKAGLACLDLLGCWLLIRIARETGLSLHRVGWYAWNPLVVLEGAGMGHVDVLGVSAVIAGVAVLAGGSRLRPGARATLAGLAAAAGVLSKLVPGAVAPLWARACGRPGRFLAVAAGVTGLAMLPVLAPGIPGGVVTYAVSWEFGGPLYEPIWRLMAGLGLADTVRAGLDGLKAWTGWHTAWNPAYPYVYPQFLAKLVLLALAAAVVVRSWGRWHRPVAGTGELFSGLLLCSATVYPWYLVWVLPWAALYGRRAWLWASGAILLTYLGQPGPAVLWPGWFALIWLPFLVLAWRDGPWVEAAS